LFREPRIEFLEDRGERIPPYVELMTNLLLEEKANVEKWILDLKRNRDIGLRYARTELRKAHIYTGVIDLKPVGLRRAQSPASIAWECSLEWCVVEADIPVLEASRDYPERSKEKVVLEDWMLEHECHVKDVHEHEESAETHVHLLCAVYPSKLGRLLKRLVDTVAEGGIRFTE